MKKPLYFVPLEFLEKREGHSRRNIENESNGSVLLIGTGDLCAVQLFFSLCACSNTNVPDVKQISLDRAAEKGVISLHKNLLLQMRSFLEGDLEHTRW
jgi:hypothetical protein